MQTNGSKSCLSAGPFADFGAEVLYSDDLATGYRTGSTISK